jgi:hypothetical protein
MYALSKDLDLTRLERTRTQQICFSKNTISFLLENIGYVTVEGEFSFTDEKGIKKQVIVYPATGDSGLLKLIDVLIINALTNDSRTGLYLKFENGCII